MEEKKQMKISMSGFFLILAIIVIAVMGYFIYKISTEKTEKENQIASLNNEISTLKTSSDELQKKIDNIANTINPNNINTIVETEIKANNNGKKSNMDNILRLGKYINNGNGIDPSEGEGISSIELTENNQFWIDLDYSGSFIGTYSIENNTLICNANREETYAGGTSSKNTNAIFEFRIIGNNKIEFITTKNIPNRTFELNKGFIYLYMN